MRYAVFSDVHANLDALERVLRDAAECGVEAFVCLGDVVGYGPLPAETLARVRSVASTVLAGNHDDAVSGRIDPKDFIDLAEDAVLRHREALSRDDLAWLKSLPHTASIEGALLAHADLTAPEAFPYLDTEEAARANFAATDAQLVFVGHTHVPGFYLTGQSGRVYRFGPESFALEDGKRYLVNVGSVGYPREENGKCVSTYVVYDSAERSVRFRELPFSVSSVLQRGRSRRRTLLGTLFALSAAIALGLASLLFLRKPAQTVPTTPPIAEETLVLGQGTRTVRANLQLAKDSPSAELSIVFQDGDGKTLDSVVHSVKASNAKAFRVPSGAARALFSIRPSAGKPRPDVKRFAPSAE